MPFYLTYQSYLQKPEEMISPPKIANLMLIVNALHKQETEHPENAYLTIVQLRELTKLQNGQLNSAMNQYGMKELFTGKDRAFGLSTTGRQVAEGTRQINMMGISRAKQAQLTSNGYLQPMTREEFNALSDKNKADVRKVNKYITELLIKHLTPSFEGDGSEKELIIAKGIIFEAQRTLTKLAHPSPNGHELSQRINAAKPTMSTASPIREDSVPERANATA